MPKSIFNNRVDFDEKSWAVSIVNTGSVFAGHSAIIVEGLERTGSGTFETKLFYGFYEIRAVIWPDEQKKGSTHVNKLGYICKVNIKESDKYPEDKDLSAYYACTKPVRVDGGALLRTTNNNPSPEEKDLVTSCEEVLIIRKNKNYELGFYNQLENKYDQKVIPNEHFSVLKELKIGEVNDPTIKENIFNLCAAYGGSTQQKTVRKMIQSIYEDRQKILRIDQNYGPGGHPDKSLYPPYEVIGMDSIFGSRGRGMNCANWCADKLYIAGIGDGVRKKPGCIIL